MNERRRLLVLSILIVALVALVAVAVTTYDTSPWVAAGKTMVVVAAGGTLLVRATNPFIRRMEQNLFQLRRLTETMEAKAAELARINRELDDFTYIASHDLKEPLRGISSYCQILLDDYADRLDDEGRRRLESLVGLCKRLGQLIDDLLVYSQIGRERPANEPVDLKDVALDVLATLGPAIDERNAIVRIVDQLPKVEADRTLVGEVFRNLIGNSLKFNDSERPVVEIGCLEFDPPQIFVRDNGIGIAEQHQQAIFTMFRRLHSRRKYEGTGAGLTFVRKIVEAHGGEVTVDSTPGSGSTFFFSLSPSHAQDNSRRQDLVACAAD